ncbi:MAG: hypothetical protein IJU11_03855, partial [Prevotella sp.]|nr:hypothetical protein [Prevotella sp.]
LKNREEEIMEKERQLAQSLVAIKEAEEQRAQAEEQLAQAEERAERMMRNTIIALLQKQLAAEDIADMLGVDVVTVRQIAAEA